MQQLSLLLRQSSWSLLINSYESPSTHGYYRNCCVFVEKLEPSKCWTSQKAELYGVLLVLTINSLKILKRIGFSVWKYGNYRIPAIKKCAFGKKDEENPWTTVLAHIQCSTHCQPPVTRVQLCLHWITSQSQQLAFQMVNFPNGNEILKFSTGRRWGANKSFFIYLL